MIIFVIIPAWSNQACASAREPGIVPPIADNLAISNASAGKWFPSVLSKWSMRCRTDTLLVILD
jgi:hypothetical protein